MTILDTTVMTFDRPEAWQWLVQFCILATALLLGNVLRTKVPFLNKSLLPSALLGGLLLLVFKLFPNCREIINKPMMEIVTYHALGLGFVALALKNNKIESKSTPMKVIETGALTASTYVIQGIVGLCAILHHKETMLVRNFLYFIIILSHWNKTFSFPIAV